MLVQVLVILTLWAISAATALKPLTYRTTADTTIAYGNVIFSDGCGDHHDYANVRAFVSNSAYRKADDGERYDLVSADFTLYTCVNDDVYMTRGRISLVGPTILNEAYFVVDGPKLNKATLSVAMPVTSSMCKTDPECTYCDVVSCTNEVRSQGTLTWQWITNSTSWNSPLSNGIIISRSWDRQTGTLFMYKENGSYRTFDDGAENYVTIQVGGATLNVMGSLDYISGGLTKTKDLYITRSRPA